MCTSGLETNQRSQLGRTGRRGEVVLGAADVLQARDRQIDPAARVVLGHVLEVLDDLQRGADPLGEPDVVRRGLPQKVKNQAAERVGREPAILQELIEERDPQIEPIASVGLDQVVQRLQRKAVRVNGALHRHDNWQDRASGLDPCQVLLDEVQGSRLHVVGLVADVVHHACECVDGAEPCPQSCGKDAESDREVLRADVNGVCGVGDIDAHVNGPYV